MFVDHGSYFISTLSNIECYSTTIGSTNMVLFLYKVLFGLSQPSSVDSTHIFFHYLLFPRLFNRYFFTNTTEESKQAEPLLTTDVCKPLTNQRTFSPEDATSIQKSRSPTNILPSSIKRKALCKSVGNQLHGCPICIDVALTLKRCQPRMCHSWSQMNTT